MNIKKIIPFMVVSFSLVSCSSAVDPSEEGSNPDGVQSVRGAIVESSPHTITIMTPQGKPYLFSTDGAKKNLKDGAKKGKRVVVAYKGDIKGLDTTDTQVLSVSDFNIW